MRLRRFTSLLIISLLGVLGLTSHAEAQSTFIVTIEQDGDNVVATGSGDFDLTGLNFDGPATASVPSYVDPSQAIFANFSSAGTVDVYDGIVGPISFGSGSSNFTAATSGDAVGIGGSDGTLVLPDGYSSDTPLSDSATWDDSTLSSLGITVGTYTWSWDDGADKFILYAGTVPVPEPSQYGMGIFLAVAGLVAWRRFSARTAQSQT